MSRARRPISRVLLRLAVAAAAALLAAKLGDAALGWVRDTPRRHLLRLTPNATVRHRSAEYDYDYHTNAQGFRGPDYPLKKPPGMRRVVVIGDSFVAGSGVPEKDLLTTRLQELLNSSATDDSGDSPWQVVNVGRPGTSTVRELDLYEEVGREFEPDVVVLCYYLGNDLVEVLQETERADLAAWHPQGFIRRVAFFWCPNLYLELGLLKMTGRFERQMQRRSEEEVLADLRQDAAWQDRDPERTATRYKALPEDIRQLVESGLFHQPRLAPACVQPDWIRRAVDPGNEHFDLAWPRTERHLELLREAVARDGARLIVAVIPAVCQVSPASLAFDRRLGYDVDEAWLSQPGRTAAAVHDWAERSNVRLLDFTGSFRASEAPLYFLQDAHFNAAGHRRAAELLAEELRSAL